MSANNKIQDSREILSSAKKAARTLQQSFTTPSKRLQLVRGLLERKSRKKELSEFQTRIKKLDTDAQHYWIGTLYTLLLPAKQRREQAAYFTPPALSRSILAHLMTEGFNPQVHSVADPAAGGAAFLSTIAAAMGDTQCSTNDIIRRLNGMEIDRGLARLSEILIGKRLGTEIPPGTIVAAIDSLKADLNCRYDVVVANPPYGRVSLKSLGKQKWREVCHPGHINKYALFTELCFRLTKPGGLTALVLPSSFIGGPLYDRLRNFIRQHAEVLMLGSVFGRDDVFVDVTQDISILIARRGKAHNPSQPVVFGLCTGDGPLKPITAAPLALCPSEPWVAPAHVSGRALGGATLADYCAVVRSGYFVWNRETHRMRRVRKRKLDIPLIWAENISAGKYCFPKAKKRRGLDYVSFDFESSAIVRTNALVIQRTTNNSQPRRLVAGRVAPHVIKKYGGFVSENHTIVLTAATSSDLILLSKLLNSEAVDRRYRELSGTASISVKLLRQLDLPDPHILRETLRANRDTEKAIEDAYEQSMNIRGKAVA